MWMVVKVPGTEEILRSALDEWRAGIDAGDVITAVNGTPVKDSRDLARKVSMVAPGTSLKLDHHARRRRATECRADDAGHPSRAASARRK